MANSSLNLVSTDFDTLKQQFKDYLVSQTIFKDYNFEGSNMNVLLDVMSYNSYLNSFYLNMVSSEMFLDSAQKHDSVVSHAKELNYLPKSIKSSKAFVSFNINTAGTSNPFTVPKGTMFSGVNSNGTFTFTTKDTHTYLSSTTTYDVVDLPIYEGTYIKDTFVIDRSIQSQKFIATNNTIDTDSLSVTVYENNSLTGVPYTRVETLYGLKNTSTVYFLQAVQNGQYEILFGDGILGKYPQNGAIVVLEYRISMGTAADGISTFTCTEDLGPANGGEANIINITATESSLGGALAEGIESIRQFAPRYFATQQRAVAGDDYSSLIYQKYGGVISDVNVYGGETLEPKLYGRVVVCLKPASGLIAPQYLKDEITGYLSDYTGLPVRVKISDPDYLFCKITTTVQYNKNITTSTAAELEGTVRTQIKNFSSDHLEKFNNDFRYSKFVAHIDNSDASFVSNDTKIEIVKRINPKLLYATSYDLQFNNSAEIEPLSPGYTKTKSFVDEPVVTSSSFSYIDSNGNEFPYCFIRDDNQGKLAIYSVIDGVFTILNDTIGYVNYTTGRVIINNLKVSSYSSYIAIYLVPHNKDIIASKDKIIYIDPNDVTVNIIEQLK